MKLELLQQFGFTKNDIAVYKALIQEGIAKTGPIISRSGVTSSRVYASLQKLTQHGVVSFDVRNNIRYYKAESPERLLNEIDQQRSQMIELIHTIEQQRHEKQDRNQINMFEGEYGFKNGFERHVARCDKGELLQIVSFSPRLYNVTTLRRFMKRLDEEVVEKNLQVQMILDRRLQKNFGKDKAALKNYTIRYMPTGYFNPAAINLSQREVMLSVWGEQPAAFVLHNPIVIASFRQNFEYMWLHAKEK